MVAVAVAIKRGSPNPVLYHQDRVGENGEINKVLGPHHDRGCADKLAPQMVEPASDGTVTYKRKNDPRVTRVGRFLRRYSLDEHLAVQRPKGEMSLIGPRPELPWPWWTCTSPGNASASPFTTGDDRMVAGERPLGQEMHLHRGRPLLRPALLPLAGPAHPREDGARGRQGREPTNKGYRESSKLGGLASTPGLGEGLRRRCAALRLPGPRPSPSLPTAERPLVAPHGSVQQALGEHGRDGRQRGDQHG